MGKDKTEKSSQSPASAEKEHRKSSSRGSSAEPRPSKSKDSSSEPGHSKTREPMRSASNESTAVETSTLASQMSALPPIPKLLIRGVPSLPPADSSVQMERMAAAVESSSKQMSELMSCMGTFMASMAPKVPKRKAEEPADPDAND